MDPFVKQYNIDLHSAAQNAELVVLGVHHNRFKDIDLERLAKVVKNPVWLDTRHFFTKEELEQAGFKYNLLGCSETPHSSIVAAEREVAVGEE